MKQASYILTSLLLLTLPLFAFADDQTITLKDGSTIKGEVTQMANGVYTIKATSLGTTQINASQVASISNAPVVAAAPVTNVAPDMQMKQIQQNIMSNPAMMADIQQIATDPEVIKLISNPAMLQAVTSRDMEAIKNNPATQELMNNPKIQALIAELQNNQQQEN